MARVDKWLWSVRVFKSRTKAVDACAKGKVLVNDVPAKPASKIKMGDVVTVLRRDSTLIIMVRKVIENRVSAALAAECIEVRSPLPTPEQSQAVATFARRDRGAGRPTKRERREINRLRGRS